MTEGALARREHAGRACGIPLVDPRKKLLDPHLFAGFPSYLGESERLDRHKSRSSRASISRLGFVQSLHAPKDRGGYSIFLLFFLQCAETLNRIISPTSLDILD